MGGSNRTCGTEGCDRPIRANGYCGTCHARLRRQDETRPRCTLDGCETPQFARTLCSRHYQHARKGLIPLPERVQASYASPACEVDGCDKPRKGGGLCAMHYSRLNRYGYIGEADERHKPNAGVMCSEPGCDRPAESAQRCRRHYRYSRLTENPPCSVEGCEKPWENAGMCGMHYFRLQATGDTGPAEPQTGSWEGPCTVEGCPREGMGLAGLCRSHRQQYRLGVTPATTTPCAKCGATICLVTPSGRLKPLRDVLLCEDCRLVRGFRWCMTVDEVAERDGTDCSICTEPVDMTLSWPDRLSPSIDHRIPRARGGRDEPENLGLAHLLCNMRKGAALPDT